jgi:ankyrin repeat protein
MKDLLYKIFFIITFILVALAVIIFAIYSRKNKKLPANFYRTFSIIGLIDVFILFAAIFDSGFILLILIIIVISAIITFIKNTINKVSMTPLLKAASKGDTFQCQQLIASGSLVNEKTALGDTALILASANGHTDAVKFLLSKQSDLNVHGKDNRTPLIAALEDKKTYNHEVLKILLDHHPDIESRDKKQYTALFHAVFNENTDAVKLLIQNGANVNVTILYWRNKRQFTKGILSIAPPDPHEIRQLLIDAGATESWDESIGRF